MVYTSATLSLAALESFVHLNPPVVFKYAAIPVEFDEALVEAMTPAGLPAAWTEEPPLSSTMRIGDQWVNTSRSAILEPPSVIIQSKRNYLLNPANPNFKKIHIGKPVPFATQSERPARQVGRTGRRTRSSVTQEE